MHAAPPIVHVGRRSSAIWIFAGLTVAFIVVAILFFLNPAENGFYPRCFFRMATGLDCPGCGGLRATHQLLHGHWREAFALNPLLVVALPIAAYFAARTFLARYARWSLPQPFRGVVWVWIAAVTVIAFGIVRNLPWIVWFANN